MLWIVGSLSLVVVAGGAIWYAGTADSVPESTDPRSPLPSQAVVRTLRVSNLRAGPGLEFQVVEVIPAEHPVLPVGQSSSQAWFKLARGTWIWSELVDYMPPELPVLESEPTHPDHFNHSRVVLGWVSETAVIKAETALWAGPSQFHAQLGKMKPGQRLNVLGRNRERTWLAVHIAGSSRNQWIHAEHAQYPFVDFLPVLASHEKPDTKALFDFMIEHTVKQTDSTRSVQVTVQNCGQANAFALTFLGQKEIVICEELLTQMWLDFAEIEAVFPSSLEYTVAATSGILAVVLHEFAHHLMDDPIATRGIESLGQSIAKAQDIATRYGTTFGEDIADLYATAVLIELAEELSKNPETSIALPVDYIALGPVMMGYVLANRPQELLLVWSDNATHSPPHERLATIICVGLDSRGQSFSMTLNNLAGLHERLHRLSADQGRTCLDGIGSEPDAYAALALEIEELFAPALPAWW